MVRARAEEFGDPEPPEEWSRDCESKTVRVEVYQGGDEWIEIPTTDVKVNVTKGESADIQRTAVVKYPYTWAGQDVKYYIGSYTEDIVSEYQWARVAHKFGGAELSDPSWHYTHLGWIGATGRSEENSRVGKFYIFDAAEILTSLYVSETFNQKSLRDVLDVVSEYAADSTAIPLADDFQVYLPDFEDGLTVQTEAGSTFSSTGSGFGIGSVTESTQSATESGATFELPTKEFTKNRHSISDVLDWATEQTNGRYFFEIDESDPSQLVFKFDAGSPTRRHFPQQEVAELTEEWGEENGTVHVIENTALNEMEPMNAVTAIGAKSLDIPEYDAQYRVEILQGSTPESEVYPYATVRHEPLYQAAGERQLGDTIEVDTTKVDATERAATKELTDRLSEVSEGEILLYGFPFALPGDRITAYETCPNVFEQTVEPVSYEVEEVIHTDPSDDFFKTHVRVSIWANEQHIDVVSSGHSEL